MCFENNSKNENLYQILLDGFSHGEGKTRDNCTKALFNL